MKAAHHVPNPIVLISLSPSRHVVAYPVNQKLALLSAAEMAATQRLAEASPLSDLNVAKTSATEYKEVWMKLPSRYTSENRVS